MVDSELDFGGGHLFHYMALTLLFAIGNSAIWGAMASHPQDLCLAAGSSSILLGLSSQSPSWKSLL